jgi:hypothetical protein
MSHAYRYGPYTLAKAPSDATFQPKANHETCSHTPFFVVPAILAPTSIHFD